VFPDTALEGLMILVGRIMERSQSIDKVIGMDGSVLGEELSGETFRERQRLWECDDDVLDDLERIADFASIDEMRFPLMDFLAEQGEGARGILAKMQFGVHSRVMGMHRVSKRAKDRGVFLSFKVGSDKDATMQHEWLWWPASTIPAMADDETTAESLELLQLENEGWTTDQEKRLDELWKPDGSPVTSKTHIFPDIHVAKTPESVWEEEWGEDPLKHWIWRIAEDSVRHIIRERADIIQLDRMARKTKTGLNSKLAPIIRQYANQTNPRLRADPVRVKRISKLIDENRIPGSAPYTELMKQFAEMEKLHQADKSAHPEPDFGWFIHALDRQLEKDRIHTAAKVIRAVESIQRSDIQLVAYLVVN